MSHRPVVCQLVHTLHVGGAEVLAGNIARALRDRYRFVFACLDELGPGADRLRAEGYTVECVGRRPGLDWRCPLRLAALWRREGVELVHAHQYTPFFYALVARLWNRRPAVVFTEHGRHFPDFPRPKRKVATRLLLDRRDRVIAVGGSVKRALIDYEGISADRIEVILNGIDTDRYAPDPAARATARAELGLDADTFAVAMVARLDPIKDHLTAVRACAAAAKQVPGLQLLIVGDGPERPAIEAFVRDQRLEGVVKLLGTRTDVPRILAASDTLLLTSVSEGVPLTLIEAMAAGRPVVSTEVGSVADVVTPDVGRLAPARDDAALAAHLIELGGSPALRAELGRGGRERAVSVFSEATMAERYAGLFDSLLPRPTSPVRGRAPSLVS